MPKEGKDKSKDKSTTKPIPSQGDGDSDIEEEQIKVSKISDEIFDLALIVTTKNPHRVSRFK